MLAIKKSNAGDLFIFQYIFFCTVLPSGYIYNIPIKLVSILIFFISFFVKILIKEKISITSQHKLYLFFHVFLFISIPISIFNGYEIEFVFKELILIISFSIPVILILILIHNNLLSKEKVSRSIVFSGGGFALWKSILFFGVFIGYWGYESDVKYFFEITQYRPVGLDIAGGFSRFSYVILDLTALIIYFYWLINRVNLKLDGILFCFVYSFLMFVVVFSAYSRFIFIYSFVLLFLYGVMYNKKVFLLCIIFSIVSFFCFFDEIRDIIFQRFIGQEHSDVHREDMVDNLLAFFYQSPIWGWGIGSYIRDYIRDSSLPFSYEVQFLLLLAQFGIVFLLFVFYVFLDYFRVFFHLGGNKKNIFFSFIFFVFYMASSFTNQYLTSSSSLSLVLVIALLRYSETPSFNKVKVSEK